MRLHLGSGLIVAAAVASAPAWAVADVVFSDNFDSETVGTFPSTFTVTNTLPASMEAEVINTTSVSSPNSFQVGNPSNDAFELSRFFTATDLGDVESFTYGYQLNVTSIPNGSLDGNAGFTIALGSGSAGGYVYNLNGGGIRVFSDAGETNQYRLFDPSSGTILAGDIPINTFQEIEVVVTPTAVDGTTGTYQYFLNGTSLGTFNYIQGPTQTTINGVRITPNNGTGVDEDITFVLDDVFASTVVPEPGGVALLLGAAVPALLRRRGR